MTSTNLAGFQTLNTETRDVEIGRDEFAINRAGPIWSRLAARLTDEIGSDNANVNMIAYGEHDMVALTELPHPLRFDPKTLETLGPFEWSDELKSQVTTARPHYDATRRLFYNFEIDFGRKSLYRFTRMIPGSHSRSVVAGIETSETAYTHSSAMSERYQILAEFPLVTRPLRLSFSGRPFIETYRWSPARGLRFTRRNSRAWPISALPGASIGLQDYMLVLDGPAGRNANTVFMASPRLAVAVPILD